MQFRDEKNLRQKKKVGTVISNTKILLKSLVQLLKLRTFYWPFSNHEADTEVCRVECFEKGVSIETTGKTQNSFRNISPFLVIPYKLFRILVCGELI